MTHLRSTSRPATIGIWGLLGLATVLVTNHAARARVSDGALLLRWSGSALPGSSVILLGPAGGKESAALTPADSTGPLPEHRFAPVPAGVVRLERRDARGELQQIWDIPLAAELTTVANLDLEADSLRIDPVHPDPFGNWETLDKAECDILPGTGPQGALAMDTRPQGRGDALLDGSSSRLMPHLDPRPFALEGRAAALQIPLSTPSPARGSSAPWLLTHGVSGSAGSVRGGGGAGGQAYAMAQKDFCGELFGLGRFDFSGALQGETDQDAGPLGIADSRLPDNKLTEMETQATAFFRPAGGGLARFDFYAYGQQRYHFLQEFLQNSAHNPREDRADLVGSGAYDFHAGRVGVSIDAAYTRTVNKTGDGQAFDDPSEYTDGPASFDQNEEAVTTDGLYWRGTTPGTSKLRHLYNYLTQDATTVRQLGAEVAVLWRLAEPLRLGIQSQWTTYRWYENLDPIDARAGDPSALQNYASYLGYSADGVSYTSTGTNGPLRPRTTSAYASQRFQIGALTVEGGTRLESFSSGERPVLDPIDPSRKGTKTSLGDADLAPEVTRSGLDPRLGIYFPVGSTSFWIDAGSSRVNPPLEALYYSPNVLLHQSSMADTDVVGFTKNLIFGNPALKPEVTRSAQLGLYRRISPKVSLRVSANVAETRDTWTAVQYRANGVAGEPNDFVNYYENRGQRREAGLHLGISDQRSERTTVRLSYDLSQTETNVLEPAQLYRNRLVPGMPSQGSAGGEFAPPIPLWFDQSGQTSYFPSLLDHRHRLALSWITRMRPDAGGVLLAPLLRNADVALTMEAASGAPYTPTGPYQAGRILANGEQLPFVPGPQPRDTNGNGVIDHSEINTFRMPWSWQLDLSFRRQFHFGPGRLNLRIEGRNLTDQRNVQVVYGYTGLPDDDGWLSANAGGVTKEFAAAYRGRVNNPLNFGEGRSLRVSLSYDH